MAKRVPDTSKTSSGAARWRSARRPVGSAGEHRCAAGGGGHGTTVLGRAGGWGVGMA